MISYLCNKPKTTFVESGALGWLIGLNDTSMVKMQLFLHKLMTIPKQLLFMVYFKMHFLFF